MMKKIITLCLLTTLCGCGNVIPVLPSNRDFTDTTVPVQENAPKTKAAMLLPLSGSTALVGENFQNAALMSGLEHETTSTDVLFYDTKGTPDGAVNAYRQAKNESPDIILGPVFAPEVQALHAEGIDTPVISFTSDTSVLNDHIYTLALLIPQQVNRIVDYACAQGQYRFAIIGPQDKTGSLVVKAFENAIQSCPTMRLTHISLYKPDAADLTTPVTRIAPPLIDARKKDLTEKEKELLRHPTAERLSFDALFIFETGVKLEQLVSILNYYDITPQIVPFYGLATLRQARNNQLIGSYFADMPQNRLNIFKKKYEDAFGKTPLPVASFGYDAVSLITFLSQQRALNETALTDSVGYNGMNGRFRLNKDGTNDRLLDIFQLSPYGQARVVESAPMEF